MIRKWLKTLSFVSSWLTCCAFSNQGYGLLKTDQNNLVKQTCVNMDSKGVQDIFAPLKNIFSGPTGRVAAPIPSTTEYDERIKETLEILYDAAENKPDETEKVFNALVDLEKLQRQKRKAEAAAGTDTTATEMLKNLKGDWRLVFTTGTGDTQKKIGGRINYFPIKAVQSFNPSSQPMTIENGIYLGDFAVLKFFGDFEFDLKKCKLEFDFDKIAVLGFPINLPKGKAAEIGSATGLGSENNVKLAEQKKKPFFNWVSADEKVATARGGGGGLALWKRVV